MYSWLLQGFWGDLAQVFHWNKPWEAPFTRSNINLDNGPASIEWFIGAETNVVSAVLGRQGGLWGAAAGDPCQSQTALDLLRCRAAAICQAPFRQPWTAAQLCWPLSPGRLVD